MNSKIKYLLVLSFTLVTMGSTIFAAERAPAPDLRYQRVFFVPECPICFEALTADDTVQTTCRHLFHRRCLEAALARNNVCPSCRHNFGAPAAAHAEPAPACCAAAACPVEPHVIEREAQIGEPVRPVEQEEVRLPQIIIDPENRYYDRSNHNPEYLHHHVFYIKFDNLAPDMFYVIGDLFDIFFRKSQYAACPRLTRCWNPSKLLFRVLTRKDEQEFGQYLNDLTRKFFNRNVFTYELGGYAFRLSDTQRNRYFR